MFVPMLYVTPLPIDSVYAYTTTQFVLNFCKNSAYDGKTMEVAVNLPYKPWNVTMGQSVSVSVYNNADFSGTPLATNVDSTGSPVPKFPLVYNYTWGDLYLKMTTGPSPSIVFTASASFGSAFAASSLSVDVETSRHQSRNGNGKGFLGGNTKTIAGGGSDIITMAQIINDFEPFQVMTSDLILINFTYCPSSVQTYEISVSCTAVDDISATSLYVCVKSSEFPCSPFSAQQAFTDPSGTAVTSVLLSTTTQQFSQMQAAVVGWGVYNAINSFLFTVVVNTYGVY